MEELKMLIDMVAALPEMALWVVILFWMYKTLVLGSIYGVIRLAINKAHDVFIQRRIKYVDFRPMIDGLVIQASCDALMTQILRLRNRAIKDNSKYIHDSDVNWLREAIDEKIAREQAGENK
jgi:hypothetical protein